MSKYYPIYRVENFFRVELGVTLPLAMTYTNDENYNDLEWWQSAHDPANHTILKVESKLLHGDFTRETIESNQIILQSGGQYTDIP